MQVIKSDVEQIRQEKDMVRVRSTVRALTTQLRFSLVDQTKVITAASEIARNTLVYGKGGTLTVEVIKEGSRLGLRLVFDDQGPGIADLKLAMQDGFTTGSGLGLGLGGSRRLVNEFNIESNSGCGTRITLIKWK